MASRDAMENAMRFLESQLLASSPAVNAQAASPPPYKRPPIEVPPIEILPIEIEAPPFLGISGWPMAEQKEPKAKKGRGRRFLLA
jgi:hypothetical protein